MCLRSTQRECGQDAAPLRSLLRRLRLQVHYCADSGYKSTTAQTPVPSPLLRRLRFQVHYCADSGSKSTTAQTPVPSPILRRLRFQVHYCADSGYKSTTAQTPVTSPLLRRLRFQVHYCADSGYKSTTAQTPVTSPILRRHRLQVHYCADSGYKSTTVQTPVPSPILHLKSWVEEVECIWQECVIVTGLWQGLVSSDDLNGLPQGPGVFTVTEVIVDFFEHIDVLPFWCHLAFLRAALSPDLNASSRIFSSPWTSDVIHGF